MQMTTTHRFLEIVVFELAQVLPWAVVEIQQ